jgi:hypothetical protein
VFLGMIQNKRVRTEQIKSTDKVSQARS